MITGAALIMVVVCGGFVRAKVVIVTSMGCGPAPAVLLVATVLRGLPTPARMGWLDRGTGRALLVKALVARRGLGHGEAPAATWSGGA